MCFIEICKRENDELKKAKWNIVILYGLPREGRKIELIRYKARRIMIHD